MWVTPGNQGWWPRIQWPYVAHGNRAIYISHVPSKSTQRYLNVDGYCHGWLSQNEALCSEVVEPNSRFVFVLNPAAVSASSSWETYEGLQAIHASLGHWAAWDTSDRLWYDGKVIREGYYGLRQHGLFIASKCKAENFDIHVFYDGELLRKVKLQEPAFDWDIIGDGPEPGTVCYGYPKVYLSYPSGAQKEITRSPYREGSTGNQGFKLVNCDGVLWLWSAAQIGPDDRWGAIGGPVGDPAVQIINMPTDSIDAQYIDHLFHIAGSGWGSLWVDTTIDVDARRPITKAPEPTPEPVPTPTVPVPTPTPEPTPTPIPTPVPNPGTTAPIVVTKKTWWERLIEALMHIFGGN